MDIQDQSKPTTPSGHESDGVHICERCGWPFPNSHPSSKHRRAHNRICGSIEAYTDLIDTQPVSDDDDDDVNDKTPSPKLEKRINGNGTGGIVERSNKSEDDLFSDAVTEFSDTGISPGAEGRVLDTTKLLDSPIELKEFDDNSELFETPDGTHTKDGDKTEENDINMKHHSAKTQVKLPDSDIKPSLPLVEDRDGSHEDEVVDLVEPSNTVQTKPNSDSKNQGEEAKYVVSILNDMPLADDAETLLTDFKDHKTVYSDIPHGKKDLKVRYMVDSFEVKTAEVNIDESQASENGESSMKSAVSENTNFTDFSDFVPTVGIVDAKIAKTQPLEMSKSCFKFTENLSEAKVSHDKHSVVTLDEGMDKEGYKEEIDGGKFESDNERAQKVIKRAEIDHSVPVFNDAYTQEIVKEHQNGIEARQNIVDSLVADDSKDSGNVGISDSSEEVVLDKAEESCDASWVVSEGVVDEGDGKLINSKHFGVDASIDSSSRNSVEGNWGSVSVLSTASIDAENAHSSVKSEMLVDKSHLAKSDVFESSSLVKPKEEIVDHEASEINAVTVQNSQPLKSEVNISNETEGRKRNEEAIAKVTNWSTGEGTTTLKNLVSEVKTSNPTQLSTMIQIDEAADKASEPGKSILVNQESSPPKYIGEGKKLRKKSKGRPSWLPFGCCSSVNVN